MKRIKEGYKGVELLGFQWVDNDSWEFTFLNPMPGNNVATGFAWLPEKEFSSWDDAVEFMTKPEHLPFWIERNGYHLEKYFFRMVDFFSFLPGAPTAEGGSLSLSSITGKFKLPDVQKKLEAMGVIPDAFAQY